MKKMLGLFIGFIVLITISACTIQKTDTNTPQNTNTKNQINQNSTNILDISSHNKASDCWTIINGITYDLTDYISSNTHPAGNASLLSICGKDGTNLFNNIRKHSSALTNDVLNKYKIN